MPSFFAALRRIRAIALNSLREAMRQRFFHLLAVLALAMIGGVILMNDFDFGGNELKFAADLGLGGILFFGSILAVVTTAQLFFSELENRTALMVLSRPVSVTEFMLGKFLGSSLLLLFFTVPLYGLLMGLLYWRETFLMMETPLSFDGQRIVAYDGIALSCLFQWLRLSIIASITLLICSFARTLVYSMTVSFFVVVICQLQYLAYEQWYRIINWPVRMAAGSIALMFPNLQLFNIGDGVAQGVVPTGEMVGATLLYGLGYLLIFNALTIFSFRRRLI